MIHVDDVIHVRMGIDPNSTLTGLSPFFALLQEAATDIEAATTTATVLRNAGIMGSDHLAAAHGQHAGPGPAQRRDGEGMGEGDRRPIRRRQQGARRL